MINLYVKIKFVIRQVEFRKKSSFSIYKRIVCGKNIQTLKKESKELAKVDFYTTVLLKRRQEDSCFMVILIQTMDVLIKATPDQKLSVIRPVVIF